MKTKQTGSTSIKIAALVVAGIVVTILGVVLINRFFKTVDNGVETGGDIVKDVLVNLPSIFTREILIDEFTQHIDKLEGTTHLQVAKVNSTEAFIVEDRAYILELNVLPTVKVMMQGPVEFTFYLDLKEQWDFRWEKIEDGITVIAPKIHYNMPAVDISNSSLTVDGSVLRNEDIAQEKLKKAITPLCIRKAQAKISFVRDTARNSTKQFVEAWFVNLRFHDSERKPYIKAVYFADEVLPDGLLRQPSE